LRPLFTCCHPAPVPEARIALTLRLLDGLTMAGITRAFLLPESPRKHGRSVRPWIFQVQIA
jgi:RNA polymerase sigma-70 factor, ECF subfamily